MIDKKQKQNVHLGRQCCYRKHAIAALSSIGTDRQAD